MKSSARGGSPWASIRRWRRRHAMPDCPSGHAPHDSSARVETRRRLEAAGSDAFQTDVRLFSARLHICTGTRSVRCHIVRREAIIVGARIKLHGSAPQWNTTAAERGIGPIPCRMGCNGCMGCHGPLQHAWDRIPKGDSNGYSTVIIGAWVPWSMRSDTPAPALPIGCCILRRCMS